MTRRTMRRTRRFALVAVSVLTALAASGARTQDLPSSLEPQPLVDALEAFANATGLQLIYRAALGVGVPSKGAKAGGTVEETLRQLLEGTGLTFAFVNERTVTILVKDATAADVEEGPSEQTVVSAKRSASERTYRDDDGISALSKDQLEQAGYIVITGSHIPGAAPVGDNIVTFTRREIDQTGLATAHEVLRLLPQSFNGGFSEDVRSGEARFNTSGGTGIDLRGLGAGSTLVLINGRRVAPSGGEGRFVDLSAIPLTAVERIEVLPYSASAIYGADAVGGVVNFILREYDDSNETQVRYGAVTQGPTAENQLSQSAGLRWGSGKAQLSFELYTRDALPAAERAQAAVSDLRRWGGDNFDVLEGNPGTLVAAGRSWVIPSGQNGQFLDVADLIPGRRLHNQNEGQDLLWKHRRLSVAGTGRERLGERVELFADLVYSERDSLLHRPMLRQILFVPSSNPFYVNPTGGTDPVLVHYGFGDDFGNPTSDVTLSSLSGSFGGTASLGREWELKTSLTAARAAERLIESRSINQTALDEALADDDPATAFNPFGDGSFTNPVTLASIGEDVVSSWRIDIDTLNLAAEGPLGHLYDREVKLAVGADLQRHAYQSRRDQRTKVWWNRALHREIFAGYAEMRLPIFSADHRRPGFERLDLSLAARHEDYGRFGADNTPRAGLLWSPIKNLSIRATWSQAFGAPLLLELDESANAVALYPQIDPASATGFSTVLVWFGDGNRDLHNETATSRTLGFDLNFPAYGMSFDMTYFDIELWDGTLRPEGSLAMLQDPRMTGLVTWNPSRELRESLCAQNTFAGNAGVSGDPADCVNANVVALIDLRTQNIAAVRTSGVDFHAAYRTADSRIGSVGFDLAATYLLKFSRAQFGGGAYIDVVNTQHNPIDLRLKSTLSWKYRGFESSYSLHYFDHYTDVRSIPNRKVSSWTTMDLQLSYDLGDIGHEPLDGAVVSLSAQNLLDKEPPFLNNPMGLGYDEENADLLGRFVSIQLRKTW